MLAKHCFIKALKITFALSAGILTGCGGGGGDDDANGGLAVSSLLPEEVTSGRMRISSNDQSIIIELSIQNAQGDSKPSWNANYTGSITIEGSSHTLTGEVTRSLNSTGSSLLLNVTGTSGAESLNIAEMRLRFLYVHDAAGTRRGKIVSAEKAGMTVNVTDSQQLLFSMPTNNLAAQETIRFEDKLREADFVVTFDKQE